MSQSKLVEGATKTKPDPPASIDEDDEGHGPSVVDMSTETSSAVITHEDWHSPPRAVESAPGLEGRNFSDESLNLVDEDKDYNDIELENEAIAVNLPRTKFIFVKHTTAELKFLNGATHKYELFNAEAATILYGKESPSTEHHIGIGTHIDIQIFTSNGELLLKMEGRRGGPRPKLAVYSRNKTLMGEVIQKKKKCSEPSFRIMDKNSDRIAVIRLSVESRRIRGNCLTHFCGLSPVDDDHLIFDIFGLGLHSHTRIGGIGFGIGKFFPELPTNLDKCMGVEFQKGAERKLLRLMFLAALFIRPIPQQTTSVTSSPFDSRKNSNKQGSGPNSQRSSELNVDANGKRRKSSDGDGDIKGDSDAPFYQVDIVNQSTSYPMTTTTVLAGSTQKQEMQAIDSAI